MFPDGTTFLGLLLSAFAQLVVLKQGGEVHGYAVSKSYELSIEVLNNSLVEMYCKCNSMDNARTLLRKWQGRILCLGIL